MRTLTHSLPCSMTNELWIRRVEHSRNYSTLPGNFILFVILLICLEVEKLLRKPPCTIYWPDEFNTNDRSAGSWTHLTLTVTVKLATAETWPWPVTSSLKWRGMTLAVEHVVDQSYSSHDEGKWERQSERKQQTKGHSPLGHESEDMFSPIMLRLLSSHCPQISLEIVPPSSGCEDTYLLSLHSMTYKFLSKLDIPWSSF